MPCHRGADHARGGIPLAPPSYELEGEVARTFGSVRLGLSAGYGRYQEQVVSRVQLAVGHRF